MLKNRAEMLKVELHTHTADDPVDRIPYTTFELIDRAIALDYDAMAVTLHERQLDLRRFAPYAAERGLVLIPGIERTIEGRHVLLLNFPTGTEDVRTFDDLARLRSRAPGLVIAPHPFFPTAECLKEDLDRHADLFDAVERNAMFTRTLDFNRRAESWALHRGKPLVGNCDVHRLRQLGTTYSLVDAPPDPDAICVAIAAGRVRVESCPLAWTEAVSIVTSMELAGRWASLQNGFNWESRPDRCRREGILEMHASAFGTSCNASGRGLVRIPRDLRKSSQGHEPRMQWSLEGYFMKLICAAFGMAAMCAIGVGAQSGTTQTKTKVEVKNGKEIRISGCLERNPGGGYILTNSRGGMKYALVTDDDLSKHIGHRIEVRGKAADQGDGKVKIESTVGTSGSDKTEAKTEVKGTEMAGMRYLGVKSVKMLSGSCM